MEKQFYYQTLREAVPMEVERAKYVVQECDKQCTKDDYVEFAMFGSMCMRCGEHDLGSLTEH